MRINDRRGGGRGEPDEPTGRRATSRSSAARSESRIVRIGAARAAPSATDDPSHHLPTYLSTFVGRERAVAEILGLLANTRLLTVLGAPGVGKTRLSLRVAAECIGSYSDGVRWVALAALADPALVPQAVAAAVGVREQPGRPLLDVLTDALRTREMLLVLDNCEHLIDACADLVDGVLRDCRHLGILATSREPLGVAGETIWQVPPLSLPESEHAFSVEALLEYEAVRLFVDRARSALPSFTLSGQNAGAVAQVCRRLDGIPLAIELAAARMRGLPVQQLAARLDDRFHWLAGSSRAPLLHQRTLRALVDWSYERLSGPECLVFQRLAVFASGWTLDAAEAICACGGLDPAQVVACLLQLVDKSLVVAEDRDGEARYRFLETIRQYALELLDARPDAEEGRRRHAEYFLALAEQAEPRLAGPRQVDWLNRLEREQDNLRAALRWCVEHREAELGLRLAAASLRFWEVRGSRHEGGDWLTTLLELPEASARSPSRAKGLSAAAQLAAGRGELGVARALAAESLAIARALDDRRAIAAAAYRLAYVARVQGDYAAAGPLYEESLRLYRELGERERVAAVLMGLGISTCYGGDPVAAHALFEESLVAFRATGQGLGVAAVLENLGELALMRGDADVARSLAEESLEIAGAAGDRERVAFGLSVLAGVEAARGQYVRAVQLAASAEALIEALGVHCSDAWHALVNEWLQPARAALSGEAWAAACSEGRAMPLDRALEYARGWEQAAAHGPVRCDVPIGHAPGPLTPREREVACLVARGLTNRQIAATLVIAKRTADAHIYRILTKLGFDTRAQIAAWAVEHGLSPVSRS